MLHFINLYSIISLPFPDIIFHLSSTYLFTRPYSQICSFWKYLTPFAVIIIRTKALQLFSSAQLHHLSIYIISILSLSFTLYLSVSVCLSIFISLLFLIIVFFLYFLQYLNCTFCFEKSVIRRILLEFITFL